MPFTQRCLLAAAFIVEENKQIQFFIDRSTSSIGTILLPLDPEKSLPHASD